MKPNTNEEEAGRTRFRLIETSGRRVKSIMAIVTSFASVSYSCKSWRVPIRGAINAKPNSPRPYWDFLVVGTLRSRAIISVLFSSRNRLTRAYLVSVTCRDFLVAWTIWSRGLFGRVDYLVAWTIWSRGLFGRVDYLVAWTIWSRGLFGRVDYLVAWTIWSRGLFGRVDYLVAWTIWSRGLFGRVDYLVAWTIWSRGLFGRVDYLVAWTIWSRGLFGRVDYLVAWTIWSRGLFGRVDYLVAWTIWSRGLFGRVDYLVAWTIWFRIYCASNRHSPTLTRVVRDGHERRDDGNDNFHASPRRLDEPKSSATCFFFVCIWLHMNTEVITTLSITILRI